MNRIPRRFPEECVNTARRFPERRVSTAQRTSSRRCWRLGYAACWTFRTHWLPTTLMSALLLVVFAVAASPRPVAAFCGFYVATGDMRLYNRASKVVIARDGDRTVLTMSSDFRGDPKEFAVVVPVPVVLEKGQVHIGDSTAVTHLDDFSVPRLVEYTDPNPCPEPVVAELRASTAAMHLRGGSTKEVISVEDLKVAIRAQYKVDEYDILILSAEEGHALVDWLRARGYSMPPGAESVLSSYIKQNMYFFVAKVDVSEQQRLGYHYLRPIQVAYESPRFMLPIRLGMVNADGTQEMFVFTLTRRGRVESTNYRTVRMPTDVNVPEFVKGEFASFYPLVFANERRKEGEDALFLEYAWAVSPIRVTCDPCTGPNLRPEELRGLGAFWIPANGAPGPDVFLTRLHVRYDAQHFPEDLQFHETGDRQNWQARYVIHHPYPGSDECAEWKGYLKSVWARRKEEAADYATLTGVDEGSVRQRMGMRDDGSAGDEALNWWERIWRR